MSENYHTNLVFNTRLTPAVAFFSILPAICSVLLFFFAYDSLNKLSPNDSARIPFAGIPTLLAIVIIGVVIATLKQYLNREVIISGQRLVYKDSQNELHLSISKMAYSPPCGGLFKTIMFSDGITFVQLPEIFLGKKQFVALENAINEKRYKNQTFGQETYSL